MAAPSCLLALNTAEGFLQLALGVAPEAPALTENTASVNITAGRRPTSLQGLLCAQEWRLPSQGAELLIPTVQSTLERLGFPPQSITHIACVTGPGSFTGIRLAVSSAAGLARATGACMAGLPFLPLLACNILQSGIPELCGASAIWVATHARRDLIHLQGFAIPAQPTLHPVALCEVLVTSPEKAALILADQGGKLLLAGSGFTRNWQDFTAALQRIGGESTHALHLPPAFDTPTPATLFAVAMAAHYTPADIAPHYIRPCDAEDSLEHIAKGLGLDPHKAKAALEKLQNSTVLLPENPQEETPPDAQPQGTA